MTRPSSINGVSELWASLQFLALVLTLLAIYMAWLRFKSMRAAHWPLAPGTIELGGVSVQRGRNRDFVEGYERATATLNYSFKVDGEYYSGSFKQTFGDEQQAWDYVDAMKGQQVQIRYHPAKPDTSMIRSQGQIGS